MGAQRQVRCGILHPDPTQTQVKVTARPNIADLPSVSFSPESGGRVKPRRAMEDIRTQGMIRVEK